MSLSEKIPGMKPGSTVRNITLAFVYAFVLIGVLGAAGDDGETDDGEATTDATDEEQEQSTDADASDGSDGDGEGDSVAEADEEEQNADADAAEADGEAESEDTGSDSGDGESDSDSDTQQDVTIVSEELQETAIGWEVIVVVENTSGEMQDYIEVKAEFYDENDTRIDEWIANATDVEDGERVELTITTTEDEKPADYDLEASTSPF